jgi:hypothetical protein
MAWLGARLARAKAGPWKSPYSWTTGSDFEL